MSDHYYPTPLTLWSDHSRAAAKLLSDLEDLGYTVHSIFSGSSIPVVSYEKVYMYGFGSIRQFFSVPSSPAASGSGMSQNKTIEARSGPNV